MDAWKTSRMVHTWSYKHDLNDSPSKRLEFKLKKFSALVEKASERATPQHVQLYIEFGITNRATGKTQKPCKLFTKNNRKRKHTIETLSLLLFILVIFGEFFRNVFFFALFRFYTWLGGFLFVFFLHSHSLPLCLLISIHWMRLSLKMIAEANVKLVHWIARWECQTVLQVHHKPQFQANSTTKPEQKRTSKGEKFCRLLVFFRDFCLFIYCIRLSKFSTATHNQRFYLCKKSSCFVCYCLCQTTERKCMCCCFWTSISGFVRRCVRL